MARKLGTIGLLKALARIISSAPETPPGLADNRLLATILKRRSVRSFSSQPISGDLFSAILEAGRLAPSTVNLQTWTFGVFTPEEWRETFGSNLPFKGQKAIIVMGDIHRVRQVEISFPSSPLVEYTIAVMNASLAAMAMNMAAEALGVSSVMLSETGRSGLLDMAFLKEKLNLPEGVFPLMTMVFGFPRGPYPIMPPKLPIEQICFTNHYSETDPSVMSKWLEEMIAGYKASHISSSFESQIDVYQSKIGKAEADLKTMIFGRSQESGD